MTYDPTAQPHDSVDSAIVGGVTTPGLLEILGLARRFKYDEKKQPGTDGSVDVFVGLDTVEFELSIKLYDSQDFADWTTFYAAIKEPPSGSKPKVFAIDHPATAACGIDAITIRDIPWPEHVGLGVWETKVKVKSWVPPKPAKARPVGKDVKPKADRVGDDPTDQYIRELTNQVKDLAG